MELTLHRPIREWYSDSSKWWDLDYPPLTAYVSWICGYVYVFFWMLGIESLLDT